MMGWGVRGALNECSRSLSKGKMMVVWAKVAVVEMERSRRLQMGGDGGGC